MDSWILCGMQFGDEGKGTFVDYLAHENNIDCVIRYNGGSQASHTVITPSGVLHKFSQLGSGMFFEKCHTYITENMVVNLDNILVEMDVFSTNTGIAIADLRDRIHIHENCFIVTPYHKLINKLRELSKGENRRGTVGTGVSEVRYLLAEPRNFSNDIPLGIQVKDIYGKHSNLIKRMKKLEEYVSEFYKNNQDVIWKNVPKEIEENLKTEVQILLKPDAYMDITSKYEDKFKYYIPKKYDLRKCVYSVYETTLRKNCKNAIFEGTQGLLLDCNYGIKPNTTFLDTTNHFALDISYYRDNITKIGIAKAFMSRHGLGVFPTESSEVSEKICDENQEETFWNGKVRFGWFDAVLLRYAQKINQVDELFISSIDKLDDFENIKICNEYIYHGEKVDEKFKEIFEYYILSNGQVNITDIKQSSEELGEYLEKCTPKCISMKGWKTSLSEITDKSELPLECIEYIRMIEVLTRIPITLISVGPTRNNKIKLAVRPKGVTDNLCN